MRPFTARCYLHIHCILFNFHFYFDGLCLHFFYLLSCILLLMSSHLVSLLVLLYLYLYLAWSSSIFFLYSSCLAFSFTILLSIILGKRSSHPTVSLLVILFIFNSSIATLFLILFLPMVPSIQIMYSTIHYRLFPTSLFPRVSLYIFFFYLF